jgi:hypothetical protein
MNLPPTSALRLYSVIPRSFVSTVAPTVGFDAVVTTAPDAFGALEEEALLELEDEPPPYVEPPHAASVNDSASAGASVFSIGRIGAPLQRFGGWGSGEQPLS